MPRDDRDEIAKSFARQQTESQTAAGAQAARAEVTEAGSEPRRRHSSDTGLSQHVDPNQQDVDVPDSQTHHDMFGSGTAENSRVEIDADSRRTASSEFGGSESVGITEINHREKRL